MSNMGYCRFENTADGGRVMIPDEEESWRKRCVRAENALRGIIEIIDKAKGRRLPITAQIDDMAREGVGERPADPR